MPFAIPVADTASAFLIVLFIALFGPMVAKRLGLAAPLGFCVGGYLVGPAGLGLIEPRGLVEYFGSVGLLYVFFLAGVESDTLLLRKKPSKGLGFGFAQVLFAFICGASLSFFAFKTGALAALLVGALLAVRETGTESSLPRLSRRKAGLASMCAGNALIANALAVLALTAAATAASHSRQSFLSNAGHFGLALAFVAGATFLVPRATAFAFKRIKPDGTVEFLIVLFQGFLCAAIANGIGLEPAFGAFLGGILLGRFLPDSSIPQARVKFAGDALFLPFFLMYAGMLVDIPSLASRPESLTILVALPLAALGVKAFSAYAMGALAGLRGAEAGLAFGVSAGTSPLAVAIALVGRSLGIANDAVLAGTILALILCHVAGALALRGAKAGLAAYDASSPAGERGENSLRGGEAETSLEPAPALPDRIMIAISNPGTMRNLLEFAFLLRPSGSAEPLYPVAVVAESAERESELAKAENLLAQAMVVGASAGVAMMPSTRVSVNVATGILQASKESRPGTIVIGWNRPPRFSRAFFDGIIEQIVRGGKDLVIVARIAKTVGGIQRLALVLPPLVERHQGFHRGIEALSSFAQRVNCHVSVFVQAPHGAAVRAAVGPLRARGPAQVTELDSWKSAVDALKTTGASAFAVFCARPGGPAWHPSVEKLPHLIANDFPEAPLFIFYLPDGGLKEQAESGPADLFAEARTARRVLPGLKESAITDGIRRLLATHFSEDRKVLTKLSTLFTEMAQKQPIELEPGILLLHAHVSEVDRPIVFFGSRPEGFRLLALEEPAKVLVVLCAPEGQSPESHLAVLGEIARLFKDGSLAERLSAAREIEDLDKS